MPKQKPRSAIIRAVLAIFAAGAFNSCSGFQSNLDEIALFEYRTIDIAGLADGFYEGSQDNFPVTARVSVRVEGGRIVAVDLLEHFHGPDRGAEAMIPRIVAEQDIMVDGVTGSTYSSGVLRKAIERALIDGPARR